MSFPFIAFYTDIVYEILSCGEDVIKPKKIAELNDPTPANGTVMYYGLDGDDTGQSLEELFLLSKNESHFKKVSQSITKGIAIIRTKIVQKAGRDSIVFEAGDDLLFKGSFSQKELEEFKGIYNSETAGLTCSIGYGNSFQEVYLAMKIAKTTPGKNSIVGAKFS
jgi:minimal CRISPR polymerase domain